MKRSLGVEHANQIKSLGVLREGSLIADKVVY